MIHPSEVDGKHKDYEAAGWTAVSKLMQRPYWRRLWVMQELALSRGVPKLACGRSRPSWKLLVAALSNDSRLAFYVTRLNRVRGAVHQMSGRKHKEQRVRNGRHLIFLLSHSSTFETSEPRDRVYALYGLLRVAGIVDFVPDYSMPVEDVYKQITSFVIASKGGLDVLELKPWNQDRHLPSWVVDLSKLPSLQLPAPGVCKWQRGPLETDQAIEDIAHLDIEELPIVDDSGGLKVSGAIIDEVVKVDTISPCVRRYLGYSLMEKLHKANSLSFRGPIDGGDLEEYWGYSTADNGQVSLCGHVINFLVEWEPVIALFFDKEDETFWYPSPWDLKQMRNEVPPCGVENSDFQRRYGKALNPIFRRLSFVLRGRHLFSTRRGFLGTGLAGMEESDVIVAFQNTKQPHILRKVDRDSRHIGAAVLASPDEAVERNSSTPEKSARRREGQSLEDLFRAVKQRRIGDQDIVIR